MLPSDDHDLVNQLVSTPLDVTIARRLLAVPGLSRGDANRPWSFTLPGLSGEVDYTSISDEV